MTGYIEICLLIMIGGYLAYRHRHRRVGLIARHITRRHSSSGIVAAIVLIGIGYLLGRSPHNKGERE